MTLPCYKAYTIQTQCSRLHGVLGRTKNYDEIFLTCLSGLFITIDDTTKPLLRATPNQKSTEAWSFHACGGSVHTHKENGRDCNKNAIK